MAETDVHRDEMVGIIEALKEHYRDEPRIYVSGSLFIYYEEGNTNRKVAPDVFVVKGVPKGEPRTYKIWEEGKGPDMIIELTSDSTQFEDQYATRILYERLGVSEYYLYDPTGDYLPERLQAYRLRRGKYAPLRPQGGRWISRTLNLELRLEQGRLRLYDPETGERLLTPGEQAQARRCEEEARRQAEAEVERLRAELEQLRQLRPATERKHDNPRKR